MRSTLNVSVRAADRALAKARELAEISDATNREPLRLETMKRLDALSRKAERSRAYAACAGFERLKIDVLGLRAAAEVDLKASVQAIPAPEPEEMTLADALEELEAIGEILSAARPMLAARGENASRA